MRIRAVGGFLVGAAIVAAGCNESHTTENDASFTFPDGTFIDAGPVDAGPMLGDRVGNACSSDDECGEGGECLAADFLPGGYCSLACTADEDCGATAACVGIGGGQAYCFRSCEPGATPRQCRAGYGCGSLTLGSPPICAGGCTDDTDCADGLRCDPLGGFTGTGGCYTPEASLGDACAAPEACPMGGFCLDEAANGWPHGSCVTFGACDVATNTGCPGDAQCIPNGDEGLCVDGCASTADCREGYECRGTSAFPDRQICAPACANDGECSGSNVCNVALGTCAEPFDPDLLGERCSRFSGGCEGGTCFSEGQTGFPGAYCAYEGCIVGEDSSCPTGGACAPIGADNLCLAACTADADCRAGYACRNVVPTDPASSRACVPACTDTAQCLNAMRFGTVCHVGTGLCDVPFVPANQGEPCATGDDCEGGRCLSESDGWPAGTCVSNGCSLMSGVAGEECPAGSACVDDASGRSEIGYCLDTCTVGAGTGCRDGYTCLAIVDGGTEGVCRPTPTVPSPG